MSTEVGIEYLRGIRLVAKIPQEARNWRNDPSIWAWCRQYTLISEADQIAWLTKITMDPSIKMFGIEVPSGPKPDDWMAVGVCGFTSIDKQNQSAEFSLYIAKQFQSEGYGPLALKTLLAHGFRDMNLHRVWGEVFDGNPALKTFTDVGFHLEGTNRQAYYLSGQWRDAWRIGILKEEFSFP